jgi:long-chain acyl-CoA synthetase
MAKKAKSEGALWQRWMHLQPRLRNKVVLLDAASRRRWTGGALTKAAFDFVPDLQAFRSWDRIAFRVPNGVEWLALFLALQRENLTAIPIDGAMPREGCLETARRFGASALYLDGKFHLLEKSRTRRAACCCIKITSGSSSLPKAVECTAAHLIADGRHIIATMKIHPSDLNLAVIPLGHSYGLGNWSSGSSAIASPSSPACPRCYAFWPRYHRARES